MVFIEVRVYFSFIILALIVFSTWKWLGTLPELVVISDQPAGV